VVVIVIVTVVVVIVAVVVVIVAVVVMIVAVAFALDRHVAMSASASAAHRLVSFGPAWRGPVLSSRVSHRARHGARGFSVLAPGQFDGTGDAGVDRQHMEFGGHGIERCAG